MVIFQIRPLEFVWIGDHVWFSALDLQIGDWGGALAHIEYDMGHWKFEFLYLRKLYYRWFVE